jgi:hypothetical protein
MLDEHGKARAELERCEGKKETTPFLDVDRAHGRTWTRVVLR